MRKVIIVCGLPGSGKSTLAESLAEKLQLPLFSVDPIESSIIKSGLIRSFETGLAAYLVAETLAAEQLKVGLSVIIDAVSAVKEARAMWHELCARHNSQLIIIECVLDAAIHKKRIESRVRNMHGFTEVAWDEVQDLRKIYLEWEEERLVLDTSNHKEINLEKVLNYIKSAELEKI